MFGRKAKQRAALRTSRRELERSYREAADALTAHERQILRTHPENINPLIYAELRASQLILIRQMRDNAIVVADFLSRLEEIGYDDSNSQSNY